SADQHGLGMGSGRLGQFSAALSALVVRNLSGFAFLFGGIAVIRFGLVIRLVLIVRFVLILITRLVSARLLIVTAILGRFGGLIAAGLVRAIHLDRSGPQGLMLAFLGELEPIVPGLLRFVGELGRLFGVQLQLPALHQLGILQFSGFGPVYFHLDFPCYLLPDFREFHLDKNLFAIAAVPLLERLFRPLVRLAEEIPLVVMLPRRKGGLREQHSQGQNRRKQQDAKALQEYP